MRTMLVSAEGVDDGEEKPQLLAATVMTLLMLVVMMAGTGTSTEQPHSSCSRAQGTDKQ